MITHKCKCLVQDRFGSIEEIQELKGGINSKTILIKTRKSKVVLKIYKNDGRRRQIKEVMFLRRMASEGIKNVPCLLAESRKENWALMSYIDGECVREINQEIAKNTSDFIKNLMNMKKTSEDYGDNTATESCLKIDDHLDIIIRRSDRVRELKDKVGKREYRVLEEEILNPLEKEMEIIRTMYSEFEQKDIFDKTELIYSPSDIGIHNMIKTKKSYAYIDFEYGGWDDIAKLCIDWMLNPNHQQNVNALVDFKENMFELVTSKRAKDRMERLLRMHQLKWCSIIINGLANSQFSRDKQKDVLIERMKEYKIVSSKNIEILAGK